MGATTSKWCEWEEGERDDMRWKVEIVPETFRGDNEEKKRRTRMSRIMREVR